MGIPAPVLVVILVVNAVLVGSLARPFWQAVTSPRWGSALVYGLVMAVNCAAGLAVLWVLLSQAPGVR